MPYAWPYPPGFTLAELRLPVWASLLLRGYEPIRLAKRGLRWRAACPSQAELWLSPHSGAPVSTRGAWCEVLHSDEFDATVMKLHDKVFPYEPAARPVEYDD